MGEPVWALATYFPGQGDWSEEDYLTFAAEQARMELEDGFIEVLPMPTECHQTLLKVLLFLLDVYATRVGGKALSAGMRVKLRPGRFREPDLVFLSKERQHLRGPDFWLGADLVMEIVSGSPEDRERDLVTKRRVYAEAAIPEYWIVDPEPETITVLRLDGARYTEHGVFSRGTTATSASFTGFVVDVTALFDAS